MTLVVNNTKNQDENNSYITCRNACDLFDTITERCSIKDNVNVDSPYIPYRCGYFQDKGIMQINSTNTNGPKFSLSEEYDEDLLDDEEIFHEFSGNKNPNKEYTYPLVPDFSSKRDDAVWYVSPCQTYGCWIINQCKKPLPIPKYIDQAEQGWNKRVYKSPIPLHDHKSSLSLASKMAWVIDSDGYGQYALLGNGKIIASRKPHNWNK